MLNRSGLISRCRKCSRRCRKCSRKILSMYLCRPVGATKWATGGKTILIAHVCQMTRLTLSIMGHLLAGLGGWEEAILGLAPPMLGHLALGLLLLAASLPPMKERELMRLRNLFGFARKSQLASSSRLLAACRYLSSRLLIRNLCRSFLAKRKRSRLIRSRHIASRRRSSSCSK